jgi:multicomponent Na+:H+ antiporter subunit B
MTATYGDDTTVIARTVTRIVSPLIFVLSVALLLQGHNLPGGGFIAGVLTAVGVALIFIVFGLDFVQDALLDRDTRPGFALERPAFAADLRTTFALGLALAAGAGVAAMYLWGGFLAQSDWKVAIEPLYHFHFASAFAFDFGIYLVVVGSLLAIISVVGAE